jgi:2-methylcitrate dehydratase PrpD
MSVRDKQEAKRTGSGSPPTVPQLLGKADPITQQLARFAARTKADDIPQTVRVRALHHMLDAAGIAIAASRYDHSHRVLTAMRGLGGAGKVPVFGLPARLSPRDAATMNGYLCHGLDFDDTHVAGIIHPTASVLPAVLSTAARMEDAMLGLEGAESAAEALTVFSPGAA